MFREGTFFYKKQSRAYNTKTFSSFLDELLDKFNQSGLINRVIVLDNAKFHHASSITQKISNNGHRVVFLLPYSPFLNPIESMFFQWKQSVKASNTKNESTLLDLIDEEFRLILSTQYNNYYRHML
ncbi:hypothetical protein CDIK_4038, partial [Cucumispora dikerogammari]